MFRTDRSNRTFGVPRWVSVGLMGTHAILVLSAAAVEGNQDKKADKDPILYRDMSGGGTKKGIRMNVMADVMRAETLKV